MDISFGARWRSGVFFSMSFLHHLMLLLAVGIA
jgi:hypothetical protein